MVICLIAGLGRISFTLFRDITIESFAQSRQDTLLQISDSVTSYCEKIILLSDSYAGRDYIMQAAALPEGTLEQEDFREHIGRIKREIDETFFFPEIDYDFQVICDNGLSYSSEQRYLSTLTEIPDTLWFYYAKKNRTDELWQSNILFREGDEKTNVISRVTFIKDPEGQTIGAILINLDERQLHRIYAQIIGFQSTIYLVDSNGQIASHPTLSMVGRFFYDMKIFNAFFEDRNWAQITKSGEEHLFSKFSSESNPWIVVEEIPMAVITDPLDHIADIIEITTGILLLFTLILVIWFSKRVSLPFERLAVSMEKAGKGDLSVPFHIEGSHESSNMARNSRKFVDRIETLVEDLRETEEQKRISELEFLQMQINPHFIYNTLFTIRCMVDMGMTEASSEMLERFSSMLRTVLQIESPMISIIDNIEYLEDYGVILRQRFGQLNLSYEVEEGLEKERILKFILQPLIENSIYHAFPEGMTEDSRITITFRRSTARRIEIHVKDTGCGIPEETIDRVLRTAPNEGGSHIGLLNVSKKLQLYYGGRAEMSITSRPGEGTDIRIRVPVMEDEDEHTDSR